MVPQRRLPLNVAGGSNPKVISVLGVADLVSSGTAVSVRMSRQRRVGTTPELPCVGSYTPVAAGTAWPGRSRMRLGEPSM